MSLVVLGETAQQLNVRFVKHRDCFKVKINSASCRRLSDHFLKGPCKGSGYTVQINERWKGRRRTQRWAIGCGLPVGCSKKETEQMLKLRTVYPYPRM